MVLDVDFMTLKFLKFNFFIFFEFIINSRIPLFDAPSLIKCGIKYKIAPTWLAIVVVKTSTPLNTHTHGK